MHRLFMLVVFFLLTVSVAAETVTEPRQSELRDLLHQDCGSCHGMRLTGGLGPALTPDALEGKNQAFLRTTISEGRAGTPMPPWKDLLTAAEIDWITGYLKHPGVQP